MHCSTRIVDTPIGPYALVASADGLCRVEPAGAAAQADGAGGVPAASSHVEAAARALAEYFAGRRRSFDDLVLAPAGTPFQQQVWRALRAIPFGSTASYGDIARRVGRPAAARAVGSANHHNPLAIITPCHRVVGANGALVGYAGGIDRKAWLLIHETACLEGAGRLGPATRGAAAREESRHRAGRPGTSVSLAQRSA